MKNFKFSIFNFQLDWLKNVACKGRFRSFEDLGGRRDWKFQKCEAGFTLLEMLVSIGIFSVVVILAIGITIEISNAQLKSSNLQATHDNIRFSLELMTKELRTGTAYTLTSICSSVSEINFNDANGVQRIYYLSGNTIMRLVGSANCSLALPFTADDVSVERLRFRIRGAETGPNDGQPMITISLTVRSKSPKVALESSMDLQTTVVQRLRDL